MNLQQLFQTQEILDQHIIDKHPELKGQDNLPWKVLAFQVELGECANEWRGFKKWSNDQEPRTHVEVPCEVCNGSGRRYSGYCGNCHGGYVGVRNLVLEEYVDCLHFALSIGLELKVNIPTIERILVFGSRNDRDITYVISQIYKEFNYIVDWIGESPDQGSYLNGLQWFLELGHKLGFTWEQIEQAYFEKNKVNHERQHNGY